MGRELVSARIACICCCRSATIGVIFAAWSGVRFSFAVIIATTFSGGGGVFAAGAAAGVASGAGAGAVCANAVAPTNPIINKPQHITFFIASS